MIIRSAEFVCSSSRVGQCPKTNVADYAFIGRSNVGKSSLINMLSGVNGLAKVSGSPGKTRLINHFIINNNWHLVDLPGYGYARVSKSARAEFSKLISNYILKHEGMRFLFVLIDVRHEPQRIDMEFIRFLGENGVPFGIVFTKADKLSDNGVASSVARYKKSLLEEWEELPPMFVTSSEHRKGRDEILSFIEQIESNLSQQ